MIQYATFKKEVLRLDGNLNVMNLDGIISISRGNGAMVIIGNKFENDYNDEFRDLQSYEKKVALSELVKEYARTPIKERRIVLYRIKLMWLSDTDGFLNYDFSNNRITYSKPVGGYGFSNSFTIEEFKDICEITGAVYNAHEFHRISELELGIVD